MKFRYVIKQLVETGDVREDGTPILATEVVGAAPSLPGALLIKQTVEQAHCVGFVEAYIFDEGLSMLRTHELS